MFSYCKKKNDKTSFNPIQTEGLLISSLSHLRKKSNTFNTVQAMTTKRSEFL